MYGCYKVKCLCGSFFTAQLGSVRLGGEMTHPRFLAVSSGRSADTGRAVQPRLSMPGVLPLSHVKSERNSRTWTPAGPCAKPYIFQFHSQRRPAPAGVLSKRPVMSKVAP